METMTIHPEEAYLRNADNPPCLYVRIGGKRRKLFINRERNEIGIIAPEKRRQGYYFSNWTAIEKIYYPTAEQGRAGYKPQTDSKVSETRKTRHTYEQLASEDCGG